MVPQRALDLLASWQGSFGQHRNVAIWKLVPHCLRWYIWREINARSFEGCEQSRIELKSFFFHSMLDWARALQFFSCDSLLDLLEHCNLRCRC